MARSTEVPFGDNPSDTAVLLLAAAEELGLGASAVKTGTGVFIVPTEVAEKAAAPEEEADEEEKPAPKRRATKKAAKKK